MSFIIVTVAMIWNMQITVFTRYVKCFHRKMEQFSFLFIYLRINLFIKKTLGYEDLKNSNKK